MVTLVRPETEARPDLIADGTYEAKFIKIVEIENKNPPNSKYPDAKFWPTKWQWHFEITEPNGDDGNWQGLLIKGKTNPTVANEKATAFAYLQAIIKRALMKGEELDDRAFSGYPCEIEIGTYEDADGGKWNYLVGVSRSKRGKMLPLPEGMKTPQDMGIHIVPKSEGQEAIEPDDLPF